MKKVFKTKNKDGEVIELCVISPSTIIRHKAKEVYNKVFATSLKNGMLFRKQLYETMTKQGLWTKEDDEEIDKLRAAITESENKLKKGKIKKSEARDIALTLRGQRWMFRKLLEYRVQHDATTIEGMAENAHHDFLVSECTLDNIKGERYFTSLDDYYERQEEEAAYDAASNLATLMNQLNEDYEIENKFLKKYGYVNDNLELVNEKGQRVDVENRLISEDGRLVNENNEFIDKDGNVLPKEEESEPEFLDD